MSTKNKYPNADTSQERLAEIDDAFLSTEKYHQNDPIAFSWAEIMPLLRDLLAMLHERDEHMRAQMRATQNWVDETAKQRDEALMEMAQQLHYQRWRRLKEELPQEKQQIQCGYLNGVSKTPEIFHDVFYKNNYSGSSFENIFWRPIPPLPKE